MSITDFLFEGRPPKSVTTYGQTIKDVPKWLSDYTQGLIARANAAAAEPYIPYGGPRIAPFSPAQEAAFGLTEENVGAYQPYLEAGARTGAQAVGALEQAAGADPLGAADPYLQAGTQAFPGAVEEYMNPYIQNVLDRQEGLATRTLEEEFLPRLQRTFAGAGQIGSRGGFGSMEDIGVRGVRDISENLEQQRLATLGQAYGQAADIFGQDVGRQIQAGQIAGGLEQAGGALQLGAAQAGLGAMGQFGALGEAAQQMGLRDAAALEAVGQQQQQLGQRGMDLAYQDFLEQRNLPFERLGFMSNIVRGLPYAQQQTTQQYGPASTYQPSPLSQLIGGYSAMRGLGLTGGGGGGSAEGGYIDRRPGYAEGGLVAVIEGDYEVIEED